MFLPPVPSTPGGKCAAVFRHLQPALDSRVGGLQLAGARTSPAWVCVRSGSPKSHFWLWGLAVPPPAPAPHVTQPVAQPDARPACAGGHVHPLPVGSGGLACCWKIQRGLLVWMQCGYSFLRAAGVKCSVLTQGLVCALPQTSETPNSSAQGPLSPLLRCRPVPRRGCISPCPDVSAALRPCSSSPGVSSDQDFGEPKTQRCRHMCTYPAQGEGGVADIGQCGVVWEG